MEICCICAKTCDLDDETSVLGQKGVESIINAGTIQCKVGDRVHKKCRLDLIRPKYVKKHPSLAENTTQQANVIGRRSQTPSFIPKEHCIFCGKGAKYDGKKRGFEVFPVKTDVFQRSIEKVCKERNDEWSDVVLGRLQYAQDLHAADTIYHQTCSVNFRTHKSIPLVYSPHIGGSEAKKPNLGGRPVDTVKSLAFMKVIQYLEDNDEEQTTVADLTQKMGEFLDDTGEDPYSAVYMKSKLQDYFKEKIVITTINGVDNVVTFKQTVESVINEFYCKPRKGNDEEDKARIIETAAKLIKDDIKSVDVSNNIYPTSTEMADVEKALNFIPDTLKILLIKMFVGKDVDLKIASIGQAIMQAVRPRVLIAPLQIGLGIQMHHHFQSKFLVDSLNAHGFCSSYKAVTNYEKCASVVQGTDIPGMTSDHFMQHAADNVDHNSRTLDGSGTFHGMGMIATITPATKSKFQVPKIKITAEDISRAGKVVIHPYIGPQEETTLSYKELRDLQIKDPTANFDLLWKLTHPILKSPRPAWSGMMQVTLDGSYPGKSSVFFLPMIDMDASDMTCIHSTLYFIAEQAERYNHTPIVTFDQPLWWKAQIIISNDQPNSKLKSFVLRLGGLHIEMSFLGSIGHIMAGSGIEEVLELIYAKNTVPHILSGKAIARALRGHLLIDATLNALLVSDTFNLPLDLPDTEKEDAAEQDGVEGDVDVLDDAEQDGAEGDVDVLDGAEQDGAEGDVDVLDSAEQDGAEQNGAEQDGAERDRAEQDGAEHEHMLNADLKEAKILYEMLIDKPEIRNEVFTSEALARISNRLKKKQQSLLHNTRTGALWLEYMKMMDILRLFLKAERTGNWLLHLEALHQMLPYFAAAGHNLYIKSAYIYIQQMQSLEKTNPDIYKKFIDGFHVARRSDRFWGGLSIDLMIEQVLMRSVKTTGGLTRGKGMTEIQRLVWLMSMPITADVNNSMQSLTGVNFVTSEQHKPKHKDITIARMERDYKDTKTLIAYFTERNPFSTESSSLHNIATGLVADSNVNCDKSKEVGEKIVKSLKGKKVVEHTFRKKDKVITFASKTAVKLRNDEVQVNPQLMFQRLCVIVALGRYENPETFFEYEMCSYPTSLFDATLLPRKANKPVLSEAIWSLTKDSQKEVNISDTAHYVVDGGALLHRVIWPLGVSYDTICSLYVQYIKRRYPRATIVFDGYESGPTTKDCTHTRRHECGPEVLFESSMVLTLKKDVFLSNKENKQKFIKLLADTLERNGYSTLHAANDADVLIVKTAVAKAEAVPTVLIGDDTDLLVLLLHHAEANAHDLFFRPEPRQRDKTSRKTWDIKKAKAVLGSDVCSLILFVHAILGCDTTSRVHGLGKGIALKKVKSSAKFRELASVFYRHDAGKEEITVAGEKALLQLYNADSSPTLDALRYTRFCQKVSTAKSSLQPENLPPTSSAASFHSQRVYLQVQEWRGNTLDPQNWGWRLSESSLIPVHTDRPPAHELLLEMIRCNCKTDCNTQRCSCKKNGLECSVACGVCKGESCLNSHVPDFDDELEDNNDIE